MPLGKSKGTVVLGDNLEVLGNVRTGAVNLVYIDPPFGTGADQKGSSGASYPDPAQGFIRNIEPSLVAAWRTLVADGVLFVHLDARWVHYCKVRMDELFGREKFLNEIIWAYDYGGRSKKRWPAKHDTILCYVKDPKNYTFNLAASDRLPYMAPSLVGAEKAARGKTPTDVWWHTIVPTNGPERLGYPTQKPIGVLKRIIAVHSNPGDTVLDFFAGSGTSGAAALELGRNFFLVDRSLDAYTTMRRRFQGTDVAFRRKHATR